ncbi:hypothetical protein DQ04_00281030 [Trypanosoma grayi]|uniref:hypothetical protein n=1 Tax=Trypanosoma grayi TaxID=71804 RepID=UPI0004F40DD4|nr:hypothetical protein DQ04_00281030 [Trypanosoma grayi]KEG14840.1 hypothetical protein DQ04_00281030 [Trypanosoma grayi]
MSEGGPPPGVNMPKKRDPRLRGVQQPPQKQFFDSADYEVRKQQQLHQPQQKPGGGIPRQAKALPSPPP